jgi:glycerate-2-kinase
MSGGEMTVTVRGDAAVAGPTLANVNDSRAILVAGSRAGAAS